MLMERAGYRIEELFTELGIKVWKREKKYNGACPVHGGRRMNFNFYPDGDRYRNFWHCMSRHCERHFRGNIVGLVRGVLSREKYGWEEPGEKEVPWNEAVEWLCNWLDTSLDELKPDLEKHARQLETAKIEAMTREAPQAKGICNRNVFRKHIRTPSAYFVERGYTPEILDTYDVGLCENEKSEMYGRVVVPIYDQEYKHVIGVLGRTLQPLCGLCKLYHADDCPAHENRIRHVKWRVGGRFNDKNHLYNLWFASDAILRKRSVVIVEGVPDVWRLVQNGIDNVVAIFGSDLTEPQLITLECSGATNVVCLTDNDDAGEAAFEKIKRRCWFASNVYRPKFPGHDVGDLTDEYVRTELKDFIESKARR